MRHRLNLWLVLLVIVCAVSLWVGRGARIPFLEFGSRSEPVRESEFSVGPEASAVHLLILNGTDRGGLAREVGLLVSRAGCVAENIANAPSGDHPFSLLINRRLDRERAGELARMLGGLPLLQEWDDRATEDTVLLLGRYHAVVLSELGR